MKIIIRVLVSIAVVVALFALGTYYYLFKAGDNQALEELFPADTFAYSSVKHVRELGVKAATSDLVNTYEELLKVFVGAAAAAGSQIGDGNVPTGQEFPDISGEDLLKFGIYFNRQISVGVVPRTATDESKIAIPSVITVAHFQGKKKGFEEEIRVFTEKINQSLDTESQVNWLVEDWNNNQLHLLNLPEHETEDEEETELSPKFDVPEFQFCWTVIGTKFYSSFDVDSLKSFIEKSASLPIEQSLAQNKAYQKTGNLPLEQDMVMFVNTSEFNETLVDLVDEEFQKNGGNQMGLSLKMIIEDMGLLAMDSIYYVMDLSPDNEQFASGLELSSKAGIWSLLDMTPENWEIPTTAPEDTYSVSAFGFDLGEMILWLKDLTLRNAPIAAIAYPQYKENIDAYLGMDIEEFLDQSFTRNFQMYSDLSLSKIQMEDGESASIPSSSFVMIQELGTPNLFQSKVEELIQPLEAQGAIPIETIEHAGIVYRKLDLGKQDERLAESGMELVYCLAVADNKMIFGYGSEALYQKSLSLIASKGPGAFQNADIQSAMNALPSGEGALGLVDGQRAFEALATVFLEQIEKQRESDPETAKILSKIDWAALKNIELKMVSKTYETESGYHSIGKLVQSN